MTAMKSGVDVYYFTYTGCSRKIAEVIAEHGGALKEIKAPHLPYPVWLILSLIPNLEVKCSFEEPQSNVVFLCFPKWTLNCPPITYFLNKADLSDKTLCMVICYGGFDGERYAEYYRRFATRKARDSVAILIKRGHIKERWGEVKHYILEWSRKHLR
jgi:hypothetical protein